MYIFDAFSVFFNRIKIRQKIKKYKRMNIHVADSALIYSDTELGVYCDQGKISVGEKTCIKGQVIIDRPGGEIIIGDKVYIGVGTHIWSSKKIVIGNNVMIAHNCNIFDNDTHPIDHLERREDAENIIFKSIRCDFDSMGKKEIVIDNDAWIGCCSIILKGVHIGEGAIIAAGSVVTKNVAPWTVVAGNPAVEVKRLQKE